MDLSTVFSLLCGCLWSSIVCSSVCQSPQYIGIGTRGRIDCFFQRSLYNLFWYNSTDVFNNEAVIALLDSVKSGTGFLSREFDIDLDGALIINNVSLKHEGTFTAIVLETPASSAIRFNVEVLVVAPTFSRKPRIAKCENTSKICFQTLDRHSRISCVIQDARPAVPINWVVRTISGDRNISYHLSISHKTNSFFTSRVTTTNPFIYTSLLALLVCKANSPPGLLEKNESITLIQNGDEFPLLVTPIKRYVEIGYKLELNCTGIQMLYITWQRKRFSERAYSNLVIAVLSEANFQTQIDEDGCSLNTSGKLVVGEVNIHHEGLYKCTSGNGFEDDVVIYDVVVFVPAFPAYLVVAGCDRQQYCVLEVQPEGSLQCTVKRIRPRFNLEFRPLHEKSSTSVNFYDKQLTIKDNGDVYDLTLEAKFRLNDATQSRLTIECRVIETDIETLLLSTKLDLLIVTGRVTSTEGNFLQTIEVSEYRPSNWIFVAVLPVPLLLCLLCIFIIYKGKRKRQQSSNLQVYSAEGTPMMSIAKTKGKKNIFIAELKGKYQDICGAVQPIPYIRDRLYCIDRVFVESSIEYLVAKENIEGQGNWEKLDSYQTLFTSSRIKSTRRILEGDPGYGKSTLTLQLAYDWCSGDGSSYLGKTEIFILLRLRQLGEVSSIYKAIKQFLLPRDSQLSEYDIKNILCKSSYVVVVLDGFDEFPDQERDIKSDVISIIERQMFQNFEVILTTRSSCLPREYPALTKRLRLTGFDESARERYIRKAVVGDDNVDASHIKQLLNQIPILRDLCQVPLFFVMFAHMSHESKDFHTVKSVTTFFRYMISCFHSHMKNKMKDENVKKYNVLETDHVELDKLAFEGLRRKDKAIVWSKNDLCERLGKDFYDEYVRTGILLEEEILDISDDPNSIISEHIKYKTKVRFYHKLFCEWYAAHYLSKYLSQGVTLVPLEELGENSKHITDHEKTTGSKILEYLEYLNPCECHYVYRFACGLNPTSSKMIIAYLKEEHNLHNYALLCILEQGRISQNLQDVQHFCSRGVIIDNNDSLLLQRSAIQILEIASINKIGISLVQLFDCFSDVDMSDKVGGNYIQLKSNLSIPVITSLKELWIRDKGRDITPEDMAGILHYSTSCLGLKKLRFVYCCLPRIVQAESLSLLKSRNVEVFWTACIAIYRLNLTSGLWEHEDKGSVMMDEDYHREMSFLIKPPMDEHMVSYRAD